MSRRTRSIKQTIANMAKRPKPKPVRQRQPHKRGRVTTHKTSVSLTDATKRMIAKLAPGMSVSAGIADIVARLAQIRKVCPRAYKSVVE